MNKNLKKALKRALIWFAVLVVALLLISQLLPGKFNVERSVVIAAKPDAIFPLINQPKRWGEWSPWTQAKDPSMGYAYEGPEEGVGAVAKWGSKKWGKGMMKLTESDPNKGVKWDLNIENGKYLAVGQLTFEKVAEGTKVTWGFSGELGRNPVNRYLGLFMNFMAGRDFREGLGNLKKRAEAK
jgi:hypothetical protein